TSGAVNVSVANNNGPPTVAITGPADGSTYDAPASYTLTADASDTDGTVAKVEFFAGTAKLGEDTTAPTSLAVTGAISGTYSITAKATDNAGSSATSAPIQIVITNTDNVAPTVALTAPTNGADFAAGSTVTLSATAGDTDGVVAKVQFYSGA